MLFAHGFGCDQNMWRFVAPAFREDYRIVLFDYVGHGQSDSSAYEPDRYASLQGYANFVYMVNPEKGAELQRRVRAVAEKYGWEPGKVERPSPSKRHKTPQPDKASPQSETQPAPAQKKWWKLW